MKRWPIAVYGATGHTGRFVVAELQRRGWPVVAIGRDAAKLQRLAASGVVAQFRVAPLDDRVALQAALRGCAAVIHCAGPFLDTAEPVIDAALHERIHYVDVTAEQASAHSTLGRCREAARAAGVSVVPAAGFFGALGDLLATATTAGWHDVDEIQIAMALDSWHPTAGTRATGRRNTVPRQVIRGGKLTSFEAPAPRDWDFAAPFGTQEVVEVPFTEAALIADHLRVGELRTLLNTRPLAELRDPATPPPRAAGPDGRSLQHYRMECVARRGTAVRRAAVSGTDIYASSAVLVAALTERVVTLARAGTFAAGELLDAAAFLHALPPSATTFEAPALTN